MDLGTVLHSVIIPTRNRAVYLRDTLLSVCRQALPTDRFEIIVVDNGAAGETSRVVDEIVSGSSMVHYVYESRVGLHQARHAGARAAKGEILVYIDDDVIAPAGWLEAMLEPYANPKVACVGGKILAGWETALPPWLDQFGKNGDNILSLLDLGDEPLELTWPQTVYGCNMSVRKSVLYEIGGFNPDAIGDRRLIWLRGDGETGLHRKIYDAGYKVIYEPRAWLYHRVPASRLQPDYFCYRAFIQGISDSYTHMRSNRLSVIRLMLHAVRCTLRTAHAYLGSLRLTNGYIQSRARAWYWYGWAQHQLRLAVSSVLRNHVMQESYFE